MSAKRSGANSFVQAAVHFVDKSPLNLAVLREMFEQKGKPVVKTANTIGEAKQRLMTSKSFDALAINVDLPQVEDLFLSKVPSDKD